MDNLIKELKLPKYLTDDNGHKAFLTISTDILGNWCAGYTKWFETGYSEVVDVSLNDADSPEDAVKKLADMYYHSCRLCGANPMTANCNNAGCS